MVRKGNLAIFEGQQKGAKSPKPKMLHPPKLVCMHFTTTSTCMNILSQFYFLTPMDVILPPPLLNSLIFLPIVHQQILCFSGTTCPVKGVFSYLISVMTGLFIGYLIFFRFHIVSGVNPSFVSCPAFSEPMLKTRLWNALH